MTAPHLASFFVRSGGHACSATSSPQVDAEDHGRHAAPRRCGGQAQGPVGAACCMARSRDNTCLLMFSREGRPSAGFEGDSAIFALGFLLGVRSERGHRMEPPGDLIGSMPEYSRPASEDGRSAGRGLAGVINSGHSFLKPPAPRGRAPLSWAGGAHARARAWLAGGRVDDRRARGARARAWWREGGARGRSPTQADRQDVPGSLDTHKCVHRVYQFPALVFNSSPSQ